MRRSESEPLKSEPPLFAAHSLSLARLPLQPTRSVEADAGGSVMTAVAEASASAPSMKADSL